MTADQTRTIRDEWNHLSAGWEDQRGYLLEMSRPVHAWLVDKLEVGEGDRVLEIAAGPGDTGFLAAPRLGATGRLVSTDISPAMVEVARRRAQELGITNAQFETTDAQAMQFPAASFDAAICRWGYMLMPDPGAALAETRRVLKPGGRLTLACFTTAPENPWASIPSRLMVEQGHVAPPAPGTPGILALADRSRLESAVRDGGFTNVSVDTVSFAWRFPDLAAYWSFLVDLTALGPAISRIPDAARDRFRDALAPRLAPFRDGEQVALPARCWMVLAS
jgi:SAM-dependent methyltransferase